MFNFQYYSNSEKRDISIDFVKGIGILLIIFGHYYSSWLSVNHTLIPNEVISFFLSLFTYFKLPVFFIITGYLLSNKNKKTPLSNKVKKIFLPYFVYSFIIIGLWAICYFINKNPGDYKRIIIYIQNTFCFKGIGTLWFLPVYFLSYIIFEKTKNNIQFFVFSIVLLSIIYTFKNSYSFVLILVKVNIAYIFMYVGSFFKNISYTNYLSKNIVLSLPLFFLIYNNGNTDYNNGSFGQNYYIYILVSCIFSFLVIKTIELMKSLKPNIICYFGKNSLSLMCIHLSLPIPCTYINFVITKQFFPSIPILSFSIQFIFLIILLGISIYLIQVSQKFFSSIANNIKVSSGEK